MEFKSKAEAEKAAEEQEHRARMCERGARKNARYPPMVVDAMAAATKAKAEAARIRALIPTLPD